jgi:hypothetical protein
MIAVNKNLLFWLCIIIFVLLVGVSCSDNENNNKYIPKLGDFLYNIDPGMNINQVKRLIPVKPGYDRRANYIIPRLAVRFLKDIKSFYVVEYMITDSPTYQELNIYFDKNSKVIGFRVCGPTGFDKEKYFVNLKKRASKRNINIKELAKLNDWMKGHGVTPKGARGHT